jgi:hypothetical protein
MTGMPAGVRIAYYVRAVDGADFSTTFPAGAPEEHLTFFITDEVYAHAAEDPGDPEWMLGMPGDEATSGLWIRDDPVGTVYNGAPVQPEDDHTADPGLKCFVTGNGSPGGAAGDADVDGGCTSLRSPVFDLGGAERAFASYWRWYGEGGNAIDDEFAVDVSSDGGGSWIPLERVADNAAEWTNVSFDLGEVITLTDQVVFRFTACDLNTGGLVEAAVDDVSIQVFTQENPAGAPEEASARFALGPARPNPSSGPLRIRFSLERGGAARLEIFDVQGRVVRRLVEGALAAGPHAVTWDGRDDAGRPAASGLYFYRLIAEGRAEQRRCLRLE